jgi:acetyl-CoA synthase
MSRYIATAAIRGANRIVKEADDLLQKALKELGPEAPIQFPNTAYYLPVILGFTGLEVSKIGDLPPVIERAKALLHPEPEGEIWLPYLGETLDCGVATLLAEEAIEGIRFAYGEQPEPIPGLQLTGTSFTSPDMEKGEGEGYANGPIDDIQLRSWGIQLVDGRMPGFAAIVGAAKSNEAAVQIVRELQQRNILVFLSGNVNGRSIIHQLMEEGVEMGYDTYIVPFGTDTISAIYALGFATRSALTFGGLKGGQAREILLYNKYRVFAFVLALGEVDDLKYATAAGAISYGFPTIADTVIPQILPTGITQYEHVISMPFDDIEGETDAEKAKRLVQRCIEVRGVKVKITEVPIPVPYGSAFEGERVRRADMRIEFGGKYSRAFEYLKMSPMDEVEDGKIEVVGPGFEEVEEGGAMDLGIVVEVAGRKMQEDFEPVLERQIHYFLNAASGVQHIGQRDIAWIRISKTAAEKGFILEHFGKILHARFHSDFGAIVDKVQVTIITEPELHAQWLEIARKAYDYRNKRIAEMTDESVDTFYSCVLCLPEGEEIVLPDGSFMPVEKLVDTVVEERDISVLSFDTTNVEARPVGEVFINPSPQKLIRLTLSNGNTLTLTDNHEVLVDKPDGFVWIPAGEIREGDYVASVKHTAVIESEAKEHHVIDYLPDDYKISDDDFYVRLRELVLARFGSVAEAARGLSIDYDALCGVFRHDSHRSLTIGEVKRLVNAVGLNWDEIKGQIHLFKPNCRLLKTKLDEDIMYLAGLVASDGCISWRRKRNTAQLSFANTEPALIERFRQICRDFVAAAPRVHKKASSATRWYVCYMYNPVLCELLAGLGIKAQDYGGEWRGETISALPSSLVAAFLRGLFDGDGDVCVTDTGPRFAFTTKSAREARHIHLLLKKLGINSTITHRSKPTEVYRIRTRGRYAFARFRELIGSAHPAKRAKMEVELSFEAAGRRFYNSTPWRCGKLVGELLQRWSDKIHTTKLPIDYKTLQTWIEGQRRPSKDALRRFLGGIADLVDPKDSAYQELLAWSRSKVSFEWVKEVEEVDSLDRKVYNFSVKGTQNYVVNGIIVHNCQSFAPNHVCVISPERLGLCGAYNYLDTAASYRINPTGPNQPIKKGECLDPVKGYFTGVNEYAKQASHGTVEQVAMYSIMENPMTACFTRDAEVLIDNRPVRIGDFVEEHINEGFHYASALTMDKGGKAVYDRIVGMHKNPAPKTLVWMATESGRELLLTSNHKIAVHKGEGLTWVRADKFKGGEVIYSLDGFDVVTQVKEVSNHGFNYVYNLTLMNIHSYFANSIYVKNCGCFECIMMIIPEANGFMIVSREDPSMTPAGMTFSTLAGMCGGGIQTPGVMGVGKFFILSKKFIRADGGLKRIVWMSSFLKETMAEELKAAAEREGDPDLIDKIADERVATTVEELLAFLEEKGHPALTMPPLF